MRLVLTGALHSLKPDSFLFCVCVIACCLGIQWVLGPTVARCPNFMWRVCVCVSWINYHVISFNLLDSLYALSQYALQCKHVLCYYPLICHQFMTYFFLSFIISYSCTSISQGKKHLLTPKQALLNEWEEHNNVHVAVKAYEPVRYVMTHFLWAYKICLIYDNSLPVRVMSMSNALACNVQRKFLVKQKKNPEFCFIRTSQNLYVRHVLSTHIAQF